MALSEVYNMDCIEGMKHYPDNYFDLAIVDPPYGIDRGGQSETFTKNPKHKRKQHIQKDWDKSIPPYEYFTELFRCSKNQIIWGANYFVEFLPPSMGWIFWDKGQKLSMSDGELAYTSFDRALRSFTLNRCHIAENGGSIHPTQKPVRLYKWILENYASKGDKIIDTHLGSGSSRIASYQLGFDFIGFEIDKDYFDAQEKRFKDASSQLTIIF